MPDRYQIRKNGYVLIEAIVAITVIVVGLLGVFSLLSRSLSLNRVVGDRYIGAHLAAEGIEVVKNVIDNNIVNSRPFNSGLSNGQHEADYNDLSLSQATGKKLNFDREKGLYSYGVGEETRFARTIEIELLGGGEEVKVNSIVKWISRGEADFEINLEDRFFNWR